MSRGTRILALSLSVAALAGCAEVDTRARWFKVERLVWEAQKMEALARDQGRPDSTRLFELIERYSAVAKEVPPPYVRGRSREAERLGQELARAVGSASLRAARLALEAQRPDLALARTQEIHAAAEGDSVLRRHIDFLRLASLIELKRNEEALQLMDDLQARYQPEPPGPDGGEDPVLTIPEHRYQIRSSMGDEEGARQALVDGEKYYRLLLGRGLAPMLEAQVRTRIVRMEVERGDWEGGLQDLERLRQMASATPQLKGIEAEIAYSAARLLAKKEGDRDPAGSIARLEAVAVKYPDSPYAVRAIFEVGAMLETQGKEQEALARYRHITADYPNEMVIRPLAMFRQAALEEQLGDWDKSKGLLESIPVLFPETQSAMEAPIAIAKRYFRVGQRDAGISALERAIVTYRGLIERDSTSSWGPAYRWGIISCEVALQDWGGALETVDELAVKFPGHPVTAQALLVGAQQARLHGQKPKARAYLEKFLAMYPKSRLADEVRKQLAALN